MTRFEEIPRVHITRKEDKNEIKNNKETSYGRCFYGSCGGGKYA